MKETIPTRSPDGNCEPCEYLSWDTHFFGYRIARVSHHHLDTHSIEAIFDWCQKNSIECLYFLADSDEPESILLVQEQGFRLVEVRVTMELKLGNWSRKAKPEDNENIIIRPMKEGDYAGLRRIASNSFVHSRFYCDGSFSKKKCQEYYETWIRTSYEGRVDLFLVAEQLGNPIGFITGIFSRNKKEVRLELCAVKESRQEMGVGERLTQTIVKQSVDAGATVALVVTQGRNVAAQRMFQHLGFLTRSCQLYYHKWFS